MMIAVVSNMNIADAYLSSPSSLVFAFDLSLFLAILHQHAVYICISLSLWVTELVWLRVRGAAGGVQHVANQG